MSGTREECFRAGRAAFEAGLGEDSCPYPKGRECSLQRTAWLSGFYDARTEARLGRAAWPRMPHQAAMMEHVHALKALAGDHGFDARMRDVLAQLERIILETR